MLWAEVEDLVMGEITVERLTMISNSNDPHRKHTPVPSVAPTVVVVTTVVAAIVPVVDLLVVVAVDTIIIIVVIIVVVSRAEEHRQIEATATISAKII
jgi:hypothetical protein